MRNQTILLSLLASLTASGCTQLECAEGTIERDGACEPANNSAGSAMCGPFTKLQGDRCVPQFEPTVCGPGVESEKDPETGVVTCLGGGIPPCGQPVGCPKPTGTTKQTFCGQIYDFETNVAIGDAPGTPGVECEPGGTGPCGLQMIAYDALVFAKNPMTATPLSVGKVYLDNCGRFRVEDVETNGTGPFIGLGIDDAGALGPDGQTVTVASAAPKQPNVTVNNLEHWIVKPATIGKWQGTGGPPLSGGIYAPVFRKHKAGVGDRFALQSDVRMRKMGVGDVPSNDWYFSDNADDRTTIMTSLTETGANGTALVTGAIADEGLVWSGAGGITDTANCKWEDRAGASLPGIVFIQVFRKVDLFGKTCTE